MIGRIKRTELNPLRLPVIGKIRIGEKTEGGYPKSLDYFKADGKYSQVFNKTFGAKPSSIEVVFFDDNLEASCNERYEIRQGSKLYGYGNGEEFFIYDKKTDDYKRYLASKEPNLMDRVAKKVEAEWYSILTLKFYILKIKTIFGVWQLSTRAESSSIPQIISVIDTVKDIAGTFANIPFDLQIEKHTSQKPGSTRSFPVLKLVPNISREHLTLYRQLLESGQDIKGLITEAVLDQKQITAG